VGLETTRAHTTCSETTEAGSPASSREDERVLFDDTSGSQEECDDPGLWTLGLHIRRKRSRCLPGEIFFMALLKIKNSVVVPKVVVIAAAVINAANTLGLKQDMLITSGSEGVHMPGSLHYLDRALDFRTKHLGTANKNALVTAVKKRLGRDYDVILENLGETNEHLHIEFDKRS
jgi:hypothetical protein